MPEGHFVLFASRNSKRGVLGNGHVTDVLICFRVIAQRSKGTHCFYGVVGLVVNVRQCVWTEF